MDDVRSLTATAREHGMDVALDLALNSSPDHPWLKDHPEWFQQRPDGTLKYAENPPKRYQDIYNFNWDTPAWRELWQAWRDVVIHWVDAGVKFFRVDNPHTKPFPFWEWLIKEVHAHDRGVVFLAEAFTRRAVMRQLAKIGFTQSYTYFTWKNSRWELSEYLNELANGPEREYFRPNFFINTPDILHDYLEHGGPPAFASRLVLAGTLSPTYGIYSGYEWFENVPVARAPRSTWTPRSTRPNSAGSTARCCRSSTASTRSGARTPRCSSSTGLTFLETHNDGLIAYVKRRRATP